MDIDLYINAFCYTWRACKAIYRATKPFFKDDDDDDDVIEVEATPVEEGVVVSDETYEVYNPVFREPDSSEESETKEIDEDLYCLEEFNFHDY